MYGTPKSLSTASANASAICHPKDPASVPDSPNYRGGSPTTRVLRNEQMPLDVPKSESPEQDNIVYSVPLSHPSTPRGQAGSRTEEPTTTFLKPSLPVAKTKTPSREISSAALSYSKEQNTFPDLYRTPEGLRQEFVGNCKPIAQNGSSDLTPAISVGSQAFPSRKPSKSVWDVSESDEEGSRSREKVHSVKPSRQQRSTAADTPFGPRSFAELNGSSTRSPSARHNDLDNAESRQGAITHFTNIEDLHMNRSSSKISEHSLDHVSISKDTMARAFYPDLAEARVEDSRLSEQDNIEPIDSITEFLPESQSSDLRMYEETMSERDSDNTAGVKNPTVEHGMDADVEMSLNDEHEKLHTHSPGLDLNTEDRVRKATNDEPEAMQNSPETVIEKSKVAKTSISAGVTKQDPSTKKIDHTPSHKKTKEAIAAERNAKRAYQKEKEKQERIWKAHELEEQQKIEAVKQNEKRCVGTPAAARFRQKSITSPIPGPIPRKSALKPSTVSRSSSISSHETPSGSKNTGSQTPIPSTLQPSLSASRSVSFACEDPEEAKASSTLEATVKGMSKIKNSTKKLATASVNSFREDVKKGLAAKRAPEQETEHKTTQLTMPIEVKTRPVSSKTRKEKSATKQTVLTVTRDKGKDPVYNRTSHPRPIVSQVAKEVEVGEGNSFHVPGPYLGNQPGPSKSRSSSTIVLSKDNGRALPEEPLRWKEAPQMTRIASAGSISKGVECAEQLPTDDPLLGKSASRSPAREVVSSASSRSGSESDSESQNASGSESEGMDKDDGNQELKKRDVKLPSSTSANRSKKASDQTPAVPGPIDTETTSESEIDSDDGDLPPIKPRSRTKSPPQPDSQTDDEDEESTRSTPRSSSLRDETASGSASIMDEAERQLQRENRQSMEPSRSSQMYAPPKTPRVAGVPVVVQQAKTTNLLSSGTRLPNQHFHSLSSIMKSTSTPIVTAGKKLPAHKQPSMKATVDSIPKVKFDPVPVPKRQGGDETESSSEDDDDDDDDDDMDDGDKGSAGKGFVGVMKRKL